MTTFATTASAPAQRTQVRPSALVGRLTGTLLIFQFVFQLGALVILGGAINWPDSLDAPAAVNLPLIFEQSGAVALGYSSYFLSALLLGPIALLLLHIGTGERRSATLLVAAGLGVLASFAKLLGISRWLVMMPALAVAYVDPNASEATRAAIIVTYDVFNNYAGGVGEVVGVAFLSGLWTLLVSVVLLRGSTLAPRWMGAFGIVAAALLLAALPGMYGVELGPILLLQGFAWQFWMLVLGFVLALRSRQPAN